MVILLQRRKTVAIRTYYMLIDIKRDIFEIIKLKPIDTGNKLHIRFSEDGKPVDLTGQTVKFMAIKPDGKGIYNIAKIINSKAGECEIEITNQMLAVDGELTCEIEIEGHKLITTLTFFIEVSRKLNDGTFIESTHEFTALQKVIRDTHEAINRIENRADSKLTQLQSKINTAILSMNTNSTNKLADLQKQVTTAINSMNSKTDSKLSQIQSNIDGKLAGVQVQVNTLDKNLTKKINDKILELTNNVNTKVTEVNDTLRVANTKITEVNDTVANANATIGALMKDVDTAVAGIDKAIAGKLDGKLDKTGGTLTGRLVNFSNTGTELDSFLYKHLGYQSTSNDGGPAGIGFHRLGRTAIALYTIGAEPKNLLRLRTSLNSDFDIYHAGNKPTPLDIGAIPATAYNVGTTGYYQALAEVDVRTLGSGRYKGYKLINAPHNGWFYVIVDCHTEVYKKITLHEVTGEKSYQCTCNNEKWGDWRALYNTAVRVPWSEVTGKPSFGSITATCPRVSNLNNITQAGWSAFGKGCANAPCTYGTVLTLQFSSTGFTQIAFDVTSANFFKRAKNDTWQAWRTI